MHLTKPTYEQLEKELRSLHQQLDLQDKLSSELKKKVEHLTLCINSTSDIVFTLDTHQRHTEIYGDWFKQIGLQKSNILGKTAQDILGEDFKPHFKANQKALRGEQVVYQWSINQGETIKYYQTSLAPLYKAGKVDGVIGIGRNITEIKEREKSIEAEIDRFQTTMNAINAGISVIDIQTYRVIYINQHTTNLYGDVIGEKCFHAFHKGQSQACADCPIPHLSYSKEKSTKPRVWEKQNTRTKRWHQIQDQLITWPDGRIVLLQISYDITERIKAEQIVKDQNHYLTKVNDDKDRFISILAHDLKSPFNAIIGFLDLLSDNIHSYDIDKIDEFVCLINISAKNTYSLLEDILMWVMANSKKVPYKPESLDFEYICNEVIERLTLNANAKHITISQDKGNKIRLTADKNMLETILRNLISNAIKFTNEGGEINISAVKENDTVTIKVADTGVGIPSESLEKLFNIRHKLSTQGTQNEMGTGLGLLLCKEFVEYHHGKIWAKSNLGKGSEFFFTIAQQPNREP